MAETRHTTVPCLHWACPCECFAYDFKSKLFVNISNYSGIAYLDKSAVKNNRLILNGRDSNNNDVTKEITSEELESLISKNGKGEI